MTTLRFEEYVMPSASLGRPNPLPDLAPASDAHNNVQVDHTSVSAEESRYMGWGRVNGILPYKILDAYDRNKKDKAWKAAVLDNGILRATFMPQLGGRLWSLVDLKNDRELLCKNPVFQPCNLALRNAWISGGVEWNLGMVGHTPFTVSPMFTETLTAEDGTPVLRMYQYERVRKLVYRVEAALPEGSDRLFVRVRIDNTRDAETKVYWWSNMAVTEREDVRVLVPAEKAYRYGYSAMLTKEPVPYQRFEADRFRNPQLRKQATENGGYLDFDTSYTMQLPQAMDFFYDIPPADRKWIAALDKDGYGMVQTSTDRLLGRKLFLWGMGAGGRHWQTFLSQEGVQYLEIQSGIAHTQLEHLPMKPLETIEWVEAYGPLSCDPQLVHGDNWDAAVHCVDEALEKALPRACVEEKLPFFQALDNQYGEIIMNAPDGWVTAERKIPGFHDAGLKFPKVTDKAAAEWIRLADKGALPCPDPMDEPAGYQIDPAWKELLQNSLQAFGDHWYSHYQLGVMLAHEGDTEGAKAEFTQSIQHNPSPWAYRCLGILAQQEGDNEAACQYLTKALEMKKERHLAIEAVAAMVQAGKYEQAIAAYAALPASIRKLGRVKVHLIDALMRVGNLARAERVLLSDVEMADVKEGEVKLTDLWFEIQAHHMAAREKAEYSDEYLQRAKAECTPPAHIDFRMN